MKMNAKYSKLGVVLIVSFLVLGASMNFTPIHARKLLQLDLQTTATITSNLPEIINSFVRSIGGN